MVEATNTHARRWMWLTAVCAIAATAIVAWFELRASPSRGGDGAERTNSAPAVVEDASALESDGDPRQAVAVDEEPIFVAKDGETIHGIVLDLDGQPVAAVGVAQRGISKSKLVARSAADGTFTAVLAKLDGTLVAARGAWATVAACKLLPERKTLQHVLVVAHSIDITGRVVDERGQGVAHASVGVRMSNEAKAHLPATLDVPSDVLAATTCDRNGAFELLSLPVVLGSKVLASRDPLTSSGQPAPTSGDAPLTIVLHGPKDGVLIEGFVVDPDGRPIPGAKARLRSSSGVADVEGHFRLVYPHSALDVLSPHTPLITTADNWRPVVDQDFGRVVLAAHEAIPPQRIVLSQTSLTISGSVVEADGSPLANPHADGPWQAVFVADGTLLDPDDGQRGTLETAGLLVPSGTFEVRNLLDRDYILEYAMPSRGVCIRSQPVRAGASGVELRVPADPLLESVRGHVVAADGTALPDVSISAEFRNPYDTLGGTDGPARSPSAIRTDAAGGFELRGVPREHACIVVWGDSIEQDEFDLDHLDLAHELRLVVRRVATVVIEGLSPDLHRAAFECVDRGQTDRARRKQTLGLKNGTTTVRIGEGIYTLVLKGGGAEILRRDVELVAGQTLVLRP
jgi:protocatechuate 3,4-dioxygenase beta subunit